MYAQAKVIQQLIDAAEDILIIQPDNPDGDSLGSAIALEQILTAAGKNPFLLCGTFMPGYLKYIPGWDRVESDAPNKFDLTILVDTSSMSLIDSWGGRFDRAVLNSRPLIVLDHHQTEATIKQAAVMLAVPEAAATAEVIFELAKALKWSLNTSAAGALTAAILADTLGMTTSSTSARTVHIVGELVELGVSLSALEEARRDMNRKSPEIVHYKGELLKRIEYFDNDRLAVLIIPWDEIEQYSPQYNPAVLALDDMRLTNNTAVAVVLKLYPDDKVTGKIRSNYGCPVAAKLAESFGGGGHEHASGFKILDVKDVAKLKNEIISKTRELLDEAL